MLTDHSWQLKYTPDDGDLVKLFYIPVLEDAERYDRLTGYFNAGALALAARGIEGLVRNRGRMRRLVGCTLDPPEIEAIERGEALRVQVVLDVPDAVRRDLLRFMPKEGDLPSRAREAGSHPRAQGRHAGAYADSPVGLAAHPRAAAPLFPVDEILDADDIAALEREALAAEEAADIWNLLKRVGRLPPDSKLASLRSALAELRRDGYGQAMVFTQYPDS